MGAFGEGATGRGRLDHVALLIQQQAAVPAWVQYEHRWGQNYQPYRPPPCPSNTSVQAMLGSAHSSLPTRPLQPAHPPNCPP